MESVTARLKAPRLLLRSSVRCAGVLVLVTFAFTCGAVRSAHAQGNSQTVSLAATATVVQPPPAGLTLEDLVSLAIANNLQIKIEQAKVEEAAALYQFAASKAYPVLNARFLLGGPTPEAQTTEVNQVDTITDPSLLGDFDLGKLGATIRITANAVVPVYTFGKIESGKAAANKLVQAQRKQTYAKEVEVAANVARVYWTIQLVRTFQRSLADGEKTLIKVLDKVEELLDNDSGQVTENDRLRLKHALGTLRVRKIDAANALEVASFAMCLLIGKSQNEPIEIVEAELDDGLPNAIPSAEALIDQVRSKRPELLALRHVVEAQEAFVELRKAQFYPDFFIGGAISYAWTSNATDQTNPFIWDRFNFFDVGIGIGLDFQLDVFGRLAQLEQAEAQKRTRQTQEKLATEAAELDVRRIHVSIDGGLKRVAALEVTARTARGWLTASVLGYDVGVGRADELIDAFLAWAASEAELQKTRYDTVIRMTDLARATGRLVTADTR